MSGSGRSGRGVRRGQGRGAPPPRIVIHPDPPASPSPPASPPPVPIIRVTMSPRPRAAVVADPPIAEPDVHEEPMEIPAQEEVEEEGAAAFVADPLIIEPEVHEARHEEQLDTLEELEEEVAAGVVADPPIIEPEVHEVHEARHEEQLEAPEELEEEAAVAVVVDPPIVEPKVHEEPVKVPAPEEVEEEGAAAVVPMGLAADDANQTLAPIERTASPSGRAHGTVGKRRIARTALSPNRPVTGTLVVRKGIAALEGVGYCELDPQASKPIQTPIKETRSPERRTADQAERDRTVAAGLSEATLSFSRAQEASVRVSRRLRTPSPRPRDPSPSSLIVTKMNLEKSPSRLSGRKDSEGQQRRRDGDSDDEAAV